jgi:glycosylphosphatidylinositol deacylase
MLSLIKRFLVTTTILVLVGLGIYDYLQNVDENDCTMTYMVQPVYIPIGLNKAIEEAYSRYKLYFQCINIYNCDVNEKVSIGFKKPGYIPVLYITGNADSHKQVRSIASVALSKSEQDKYAKMDIRFNYFTISFNEELSALYGPILYDQTEYAKHCIKKILSLYDDVQPVEQRPKSVIIIGNSMGGLIARGLFLKTQTEFDASRLVHTIITESTPHKHAVVNMDAHLKTFYDQVNALWQNRSEHTLDNVVLVSLYGGNRDVLVRNDLSSLDDKWSRTSNALIIAKLTSTIPFVWRSVDHKYFDNILITQKKKRLGNKTKLNS